LPYSCKKEEQALLPARQSGNNVISSFQEKGIVLKIYKRYKKQTENPRSI
jgi:hypothetical protein